MSFRGGRGGDRGGRGGRSPGGRGGGRGGFGRGRGFVDEGPPAEICEAGVFLHDAEGELVCRLTHAMIPYFNAGIYLENKSKIGKVEEVFGPVNKIYFTIKTDAGITASSFQANDKVYIGTEKLLPLSRFTNEAKGGGGRGRGGGRGPPGRGGRGPPRGGGRQSFGRGGPSRGGPPRGGGGFRGGGFSRGGRGRS